MIRFIIDKDFEKLWFLYQTEGVPEEESINSFCEKNGVPYEEFDKWFRKTHQAVGRVEIENIPDDEPMLKSSRRRGRKAEPEGIQVTIQTSDGLHLRKVGLNYQGLKSLVEKLEGRTTSLPTARMASMPSVTVRHSKPSDHRLYKGRIPYSTVVRRGRSTRPSITPS